MTRMTALFKPPRFEDEEKTRQAFLLNFIVWTLFLVPFPNLIFTLLVSPEILGRRLLQFLFSSSVNVFLLILLHRGYVRSAIVIQITALWLFFTTIAVTSAGVNHQAYQIGYAVVISIAGFLVGMRGALIMVGVSLLSGGLMVIASDMGLWSFKSPDKALNIWVVSAILFPVLAVLQYLGGRLLRMALIQSKTIQEHYRNLVEHIPQRIFIKDLNSVYVSCNANYARDLGIQPEQIAGKDDFAFYPKELAEGYSADDRTVMANEAIKNMEEKNLVSGKERWIHTIKLPYRDDQGRVVGVLGIFEDITERKRIEETLRKSEERYRQIAKCVPDLIWIMDLSGRFTYASSAVERTHGWTVEEFLKLTFHDTTTPRQAAKDVEIVKQELTKAAASQYDHNTIFTYESEEIRKDGSIFWAEISATLLWSDDSKPIGIIGVTRNITDRKRAEEEKRSLEERLQRSEKMEALGQLAGGVAHDLNNVLGILSGYSELLLMEIPEGQRARGHIEKILQSTEKGAAIIQDLLTLARRGVTVSDVIDLNSVVSDFLKTPVFEKLRDYHPRVTFRTECDLNLLTIKGSPIHLEKTLMNLVSNAAESIPGKGEVTILTESRYLDKPLRGYDEVKEGDYAVLTVSDTGMGIPAENREKIFEPFYTKKTMGRSGTGLGLAIVWGTMKDHNGYIDLKTEVGEGTTFTLYFPVTREELSAQQPKEPIEQYMGNGESVLLVDDIAEQRDVAFSLLTQLGYDVHMVSSGEGAVEYLKENKADILVLDMIMAPGIDGLETYKRVLEVNPKQKAILVSGFSETERVKEARKLGAGAYVKKPYIMEKIGVAIRDELDRK